MDDKTRFDQLEEIIVETLHKQGRTIEDVGRLREAVAAQQVTLGHMQNNIGRIETELTVVRRLATDTARVLSKSVAELTAANERGAQLLQDTAVILAENRLFQVETRQALAEDRAFQIETQQALAENKDFQAETRATLAEILDLLTKP